MNRRMSLSLIVALVVVINASDLQAGVFRRPCRQKPACVKRVNQTFNAKSPSKTWSTFQTRTWEHGSSHFGGWPPYGGEYGR